MPNPTLMQAVLALINAESKAELKVKLGDSLSENPLGTPTIFLKQSLITDKRSLSTRAKPTLLSGHKP